MYTQSSTCLRFSLFSPRSSPVPVTPNPGGTWGTLKFLFPQFWGLGDIYPRMPEPRLTTETTPKAPTNKPNIELGSGTLRLRV